MTTSRGRRTALRAVARTLVLGTAIAAAMEWPATESAAPTRWVLLDLSRSHHEDAEALVEALFAHGGALREREAFGILGFGAGVCVLRPFGPGPATPADRDRARAVAGALDRRFRDGSNVAAALEQARVASGAETTIAFEIVGDGRYPSDLASRLGPREGLRVSGPLRRPSPDVGLEVGGATRALPVGRRCDVAVRVRCLDDGPTRRVVLTTDRQALSVLVGPERPVVVTLTLFADEHGADVRITDPGGPDERPENDRLHWPADSRAATRAIAVLGRSAPLVAELLRSAEPLWDVRVGASLELPLDADVFVLADADLEALGPPGALATWLARIRSRGLGLVVFGGPSSFRAGGYAATPLEPVLPLSSRPDLSRDVHVLLDVSGTMGTAPPGSPTRARRAVDAVLSLVGRLAPEDRLQVHPFAASARPPIPAEPASQGRFADLSMRALVGLVVGGPTRVGPSLETVLARIAAAPTRRSVLVLVSDLVDPELDGRLAELRAQASHRRIDLGVVLLDPTDATRTRARGLSVAVAEADRVTPEILLSLLEDDGYVERALAVRWLDEPPPLDGRVSAFCPVLLAPGAFLVAEGTGEVPLAARVRRGACEVIACAVDPAREVWAASLAPRWVRSALPVSVDGLRAERNASGLWVTGLSHDGPVDLRLFDRPLRMVEESPRSFRSASETGIPLGAGMGILEDPRSGATLGRVWVPESEHPEWADAPRTFPARGVRESLRTFSATPLAVVLALAAILLAVLGPGRPRHPGAGSAMIGS